MNSGGLSSRYLTYSALIHLSILGALILSTLAKPARKEYYSVDFFGGLPSGGGGAAQAAETIPETPKEEVKTKVVNPAEDLLLKANKNAVEEKNVKEIVSDVPQVPSIPVPKPIGRTGAVSSVPNAVPGGQSGGIGIGFGPAGSGSGGSAGAGNFPYAWYVASVRQKLDQNWNVSSGFPNRIYAQAVFTVTKNGSLKDIEIEESSKNEIFDRAVLRAVEQSNPFPPLPSGFQEPDLRIHVRFALKR